MWKDIKNYEGLYQISDAGEVKSLNYLHTGREKILKLSDNRGYKYVGLHKDGVIKIGKIHRLVAEAFIPNPDNLPAVNHKDEDKTNNSVDNLEWCDFKYNANYGTRNKRMAAKKCKAVMQYDLDGNFIKEWESCKEIETVLGISNVKISNCCRGKQKTSHKFIWKYKE